MNKFIKLYIVIAICICFVNLTRFVKCLYYKTKYLLNFKNNTPEKNYRIQEPIKRLLKKGNVYMLSSAKIDCIADVYYKDDFINAFESARGTFIFYIIRSPVWLFVALDTLTIFAPARKTGNIFITIVVAVVEIFAAYLVGLYLDTTGIGNKILAHLLAFLNYIAEVLHKMLL